jgi:hypothetical protein
MGYARSNLLRGIPPLEDLFDGHRLPQNNSIESLEFIYNFHWGVNENSPGVS